MNYKKFYSLLCLTVATTSFIPTFAQNIDITASDNITTKTLMNTSKTTTSAIVDISLSDNEILVNGETIKDDVASPITTTSSIIYYEDRDTYDSGNTYGEGTSSDKHSSEEAAQHTVVKITEPGTYRLSGKLSYGQILVDVGKKETDKVTLILDNVDINCTVAPAILFYKVYECDKDATTETASSIVDTSNAGARVIIADDTVNNISGSHVAKIYKDTADQKKLYKYDGAFYSRMSMEIDGESKGNGILNITADNEGLDTELHLTINGGHINIQSADDGINVNEDGISVFTMNDGYLNIYAGNGSEGDAIDSNGWNVINGGTVIALANPKSPDGGIDSDSGSFINGGTVIGAGNMYDPLEDSSNQLFMFLQLAEQTDQLLTVTDENDNPIFAYDFPQNYTYIVFSTPTLEEGTYHVYEGGTITGTQTDGYYTQINSYLKGSQLHHGGTSTTQGGHGMTPNQPNNDNQNGNAPTPPNDINQDSNAPTPPSDMNQDNNVPTPPSDMNQDNNVPTPPNDMNQGDMTPPDHNGENGFAHPDDSQSGNRPERPEGGMGGGMGGMSSSSSVATYDFVLTHTTKGFTNVSSSPLDNTTPDSSNGSGDTTTDSSNGSGDTTTDSSNGSNDTTTDSSSSSANTTTDSSSSSSSSSSNSSRKSSSSIKVTVASESTSSDTTTESTTTQTQCPFADITSTTWYADAVNFCYEKGIMLGTSDTTFSPNLSATREMFVTMLYRLAGSPEINASASFKDVTNTSAYYYKSIAWAKENGITNGINASNFGIGNKITIKDAVTMLTRYNNGNTLSSTEHIDISSKQSATRADLASLFAQYYK